MTTLPPLPLGGLAVPLHLLADPLSAVVAVAVAVVGLAVQAFTRWYLRSDPRAGVFAATVSLFLAAMLLVVQSGDLILTLVGWEVMGWCSFLLIGHDSRREAARRAAVKAFLVTRTADLAFVIGLIILAVGRPDHRHPRRHRPLDRRRAGRRGVGGRGAEHRAAHGRPALPALGHRRQVRPAAVPGLAARRHGGPDARVGPDPRRDDGRRRDLRARPPVRPLRRVRHGPAGARAWSPRSRWSGRRVLAFGQSDLKRLLAYSTISQIAIMLSASPSSPPRLGPDAGILHLLSHAMFKALLFLALGWLSVLVGGTAALTLRGGARLHPRSPYRSGSACCRWPACRRWSGSCPRSTSWPRPRTAPATRPPSGARVVLVALFATVALTAAYCMRAWLVLTRLTPEEEEEIDELEEAVERASWESDVSLAEMFGPVLQPDAGTGDGPALGRRGGATRPGSPGVPAGGCGCWWC